LINDEACNQENILKQQWRDVSCEDYGILEKKSKKE